MVAGIVVRLSQSWANGFRESSMTGANIYGFYVTGFSKSRWINETRSRWSRMERVLSDSITVERFFSGGR